MAKGGDGHHGNVGGRSSSSFSHLVTFETRDLGKLDIHQDQVGTVGARQGERLKTLTSLQGLDNPGHRAECMKELHVQLVILGDETFFDIITRTIAFYGRIRMGNRLFGYGCLHVRLLKAGEAGSDPH